jgi:hypothetical protein
MKVKISLILICICTLFLQFGTDPIQKDLLNYINVELPKVAPLETEAVNAYSSVSGANYTTDAAMYKKIKEEALPKYSKFTSKLKSIKPATPELQSVHAEYVKAAQDQEEAFKFILDAIKKQDAKEIQTANVDLNAASTLISNWKTDLLELCKKHNVVIE